MASASGKIKIWWIIVTACVVTLLVVLLVSFLENFVPTYSSDVLTKYPDSVWISEDGALTLMVNSEKYVHFTYNTGDSTISGYVATGPGGRVSFDKKSYGSETYFMGVVSFSDHEQKLILKVTWSESLLAAGETIILIRQ